jgi:predicted dehydrogenase
MSALSGPGPASGGTGNRIRWGIVGTGEISQQIAADLGLVDEAEITAVTSRRAASAAEFADQYAIPLRFDDYSDMLDADLDAVYIGTPHVTHFDYAREALLRGRNVLCEKPLGLTAAQVRELATIARRSETFLMEAMWMKFNPLHRRLRELLNTGTIGEVRSVRASFGAPFPRDDSSRWKPGGSALLDQGIYPVTLAHLLLGPPATISASGVVRDDGVDLAESFTLHYADGRFAQGASSMVEFLDMSASIGGTTGWITIDTGFWFASRLTVHRFSREQGAVLETHETEREGNGYVPMLREVTAAIRRRDLEHPWHTLEDTARVFESLDEIRSQMSGRDRT